MTIITIMVKDSSNPQEVQQWFNANPLVNVVEVFPVGQYIYIIINP